ncbi:hypothetical protein [Radicibacter daui]|uniref:hypothetical protein n=1 Tax=Radicibacter daui TaxID=3064829 RepID=UPI004046E53C
MKPSEADEADDWAMYLDQRRQLEAWHANAEREIKLERLAKRSKRRNSMRLQMRAYADVKASGKDPTHNFEMTLTMAMFAFVNGLDTGLARAFVQQCRAIRANDAGRFVDEVEAVGVRLLARGVNGEASAKPLTGEQLAGDDRLAVEGLCGIVRPAEPKEEEQKSTSKAVTKPLPPISSEIEGMSDEEEPEFFSPAVTF